MVSKEFRTGCRVCRRKYYFHPILIDGGRRFLLVCPKCGSRGIFRNRDYVPFLFVRKIRVVSRQYFGVLSPTRRKLSDVGSSFNPQ